MRLPLPAVARGYPAKPVRLVSAYLPGDGIRTLSHMAMELFKLLAEPNAFRAMIRDRQREKG